MAGEERDNDYLKKLAEVDDKVKERLDQQFGQLRVIAICVAVVIVVLLVGRRLLGI
ncbi:MAG: hypothetical protein AAGD43_35225 [Pseudomonadota bacterium]